MTSSSFSGGAEDARSSRKSSDFSIEHILNAAGNSTRPGNATRVSGSACAFVPFPWLHCTRYCPPRIPRMQKKEAPQKRQLGRHPRIPFTSHQLAVLEERFKQSPYLSSQEVTQLSRSLQLADIRVKIWFQNRRARERRERTPTPSIKSPEQPQNTITLLPTVREVTPGDQSPNTEIVSPIVLPTSSESYFRPTVDDPQRHLSSKTLHMDNRCFRPDEIVYFK